MNNDKIIQILLYNLGEDILLGLSDSGKVYSFRDSKWVLFVESPKRDDGSSKEIFKTDGPEF